jgi:segregation and condensation protein A
MDTVEIQSLLDFEIPENLYVPSPPLWIESKGFKGPLDLLWYLIRQQNIDILDIPVALIAAQYVQYIKLMNAQRFEIAPDYLVMAVRLIQIKSQMLLPKKIEEETLEDDPRALLVRQLIAYEDIQKTAQFIDQLLRWERDIWPIKIALGSTITPPPQADLELTELVSQYQLLQKKQGFKKKHEINRPLMTLSEQMQWIYDTLQEGIPFPFIKLFKKESQRLEIVISFQATLELVKSKQIELQQNDWHEELLLIKFE